MPRSTKGKTWEEIYGKEYAAIKREKAKDAIKYRPSKKGLKWEDIYTPDEVTRRKHRMINNNPIHCMSELTSNKRKEKLSLKQKEYQAKNGNQMMGKKHKEESKKKMSETKKIRFQNTALS